MTNAEQATESGHVCVLCGVEVRWARGLRWVEPEKRFRDERHLIRADNGLFPALCPSSAERDQIHVLQPPTPPGTTRS